MCVCVCVYVVCIRREWGSEELGLCLSRSLVDATMQSHRRVREGDLATACCQR